MADKYNIGLADSFAAFERNVQTTTDLTKYLSYQNHAAKAGHQLVAEEIAKYFVAK